MRKTHCNGERKRLPWHSVKDVSVKPPITKADATGRYCNSPIMIHESRKSMNNISSLNNNIEIRWRNRYIYIY